MFREKVIEFIGESFGIEEERLWVNFPNYLVFRNPRNKKWFALVADVERKKLGLKGEGRVDVINLKCDPVFIGSLLGNEGFLPAYHMNKKSWITVLLDGTVDFERIKDLIGLSYELILKSK